MKSLSLRQIRYVLAVAETGHFGRAAAQCHVSQPALSQQIQQVELACGTPLFDRLGRKVRITPFGREVVARARRVADAADALDAFLGDRAGTPDRPLRFGLIPTVAPYLLPEIFPALSERFPALDFAVSESKTEALIEGLVEASLDIALIGTAPPRGPVRFRSALLFEDPFVLATSREERVAGPVELAGIPPERMLLLDEGHCFRDQALAACQLDAGRAFAATSLSTIVEFVANGQGVTLLPGIALRKEADAARIAVHRLAPPGAGRRLSLVWREGSPFSATFEAIAETIRAAHGAAD